MKFKATAIFGYVTMKPYCWITRGKWSYEIYIHKEYNGDGKLVAEYCGLPLVGINTQ